MLGSMQNLKRYMDPKMESVHVFGLPDDRGRFKNRLKLQDIHC